MSVFDRYLEQAKDFTRKLVRKETGTRRWATVTSVNPVRITYDGTTVQGIISPVVLGVPVTIGDRVRAHTIHDRTYITRANPTPVTLDDLWVPGYPWRMASGEVVLTSGSGEVSTPVTFPAGRFSTIPLVQVTPGSASTAIAGYAAQGVTSTGMRIHFNRTNTTPTALRWLAVQMTPTSAEG